MRRNPLFPVFQTGGMALRRAWQQSLSHLRQLAAAAERPVSAACAQPTAAPPGSSSRLYATLLPEDMAEAARRARFPARRPQPEAAASSSSSSTAEGATATVAATGAGAAPSAAAVAIAATPADTLAKGATQQEAARLVSGWMFPWERRQMEGGKLKVWEKLYWGVFVAGMALFLFNRLPREKEEPKVGAGRRGAEWGGVRAGAGGLRCPMRGTQFLWGFQPDCCAPTPPASAAWVHCESKEAPPQQGQLLWEPPATPAPHHSLAPLPAGFHFHRRSQLATSGCF